MQNGAYPAKRESWRLYQYTVQTYFTRNLVTDNIFIDELTDWLTDTLSSDKHVLAMGDFHIHINKDNNEIANIFLNPMMAMGYSAVTPSLHTRRKLLGSYFCWIHQGYHGHSLETNCLHLQSSNVAGNISIPKDDVTRKEISYRKLKLINYTDLAEEMHLDLLENLEYNDLVRKFEGNMKEALNIIAPEITKTITVGH